MIGKNPRLLKSWEHESTFYQQLWATRRSGKVWRGEIKNRKKDGAVYVEEMTITPVHTDNGAITHYVAIKQDITEHKKMEAQFRQAQNMEAVGRLAGGVAHDFNNILGAIMGFTEISLGTLDPSHPVTHNLEQILLAAGRASSLTRHLVAFSRQQISFPRVIDLDTIVKNLSTMLRTMVGDDIAIVLNLASPLGSVKGERRAN